MSVSRVNTDGVPQFSAQEFSPRNLQLSPLQDEVGVGVSVTWERPNVDLQHVVTGYDVICSPVDTPQFSISLSVSGSSTNATMPLLASQSTDYTCCVTSHVRSDIETAGPEMFSEACEDIQFVRPPPSPSPSPSGDSILVPILGVLVGVFFLALLVVALALVAFIASAGKPRHYDIRDSPEEERKV